MVKTSRRRIILAGWYFYTVQMQDSLNKYDLLPMLSAKSPFFKNYCLPSRRNAIKLKTTVMNYFVHYHKVALSFALYNRMKILYSKATRTDYFTKCNLTYRNNQ